MFEHGPHQRIATLLRAFDRDLLEQAGCFFGDDTAIILALGEYRESVNVEFLCASAEGYRLLRNTVREDSLGALLTRPVPHVREVRASRYSVSTFLEVDGAPVRVEFMWEARIEISGACDADLSVPVLSRVDMYAEKLLANADRGSDRAVWSRDIIDLAMMIKHWGEIPVEAWDKARAAYGDHVVRAYERSCERICDRRYLADCLRAMHMDSDRVDRLPHVLGV